MLAVCLFEFQGISNKSLGLAHMNTVQDDKFCPDKAYGEIARNS